MILISLVTAPPTPVAAAPVTRPRPAIAVKIGTRTIASATTALCSLFGDLL